MVERAPAGAFSGGTAGTVVTGVAPPDGLALDSAEQADVVVVCVTYNSARVIGDLLAALPLALDAVPRCRVVLTDNASTDGTTDMVRHLAPWVEVLPAGYNAGYAGGINLALRRHPPRRAVYVLNPDTVPSPGSVATLLRAVEENPSVGVAIPRILGHDDRLQLSLRREPTICRALGEAVLGGRRAARFPLLGETVADASRYRDGAGADWATGAALLISRSAIDAAGEWDERFFLYSEETDYCLRLRDAGFELRLVESAEVVHRGGDQTTSAPLWALATVNRTRLYRKRHGRARSTVYWAAVLVNEAARAAAGRPLHRTAVKALLAAGPDQPGTQPTPTLLARAGRAVL